MANRIRGVRQRVPANVVLGRPNIGNGGPVQALSFDQLINGAAQRGIIPLPGSGLPAIANDDLMANISGGTAPAVGVTLTAFLDAIFGTAEGTIFQRGASVWQALAPGTNGQVLTAQGAAALLHWAAGGTLIVGVGAWSGTGGYSIGNVVTYNGSAYLCYSTVTAPSSSATQFASVSGMTISTTNTTNDTATSTTAANSNAVTSDNGQSSGKWYFEFECDNLIDSATQVGLATLTASDNAGGNFSGSISGGGSGGTSGTFSGLVSSQRGAVAYDKGAAEQFWITASAVSPNWNGVSGSPASNTGGVTFSTVMQGATVYPNFYTPTTGAQVMKIFPFSDAFLGSLPSGFTAVGGSGSMNTAPPLDQNHWLSVGLISSVGTGLNVSSAGLLTLTNPPLPAKKQKIIRDPLDLMPGDVLPLASVAIESFDTNIFKHAFLGGI